MPYAPITLFRDGLELEVEGLIDSGASINVLPHDVGRRLGLDWDQAGPPGPLTGMQVSGEARGVVVVGRLANFDLVRPVFAWLQRDDVPVILGQMNFFQEFNVALFARAGQMTVQPSATV